MPVLVLVAAQSPWNLCFGAFIEKLLCLVMLLFFLLVEGGRFGKRMLSCLYEKLALINSGI